MAFIRLIKIETFKLIHIDGLRPTKIIVPSLLFDFVVFDDDVTIAVCFIRRSPFVLRVLLLLIPPYHLTSV